MHNKPSRKTFHKRMDHLLTSIRNDVYIGKLQGGDYLPSLNQLSEEYKLSKNSIQKGLEILVDELLIERIPRIGIRVLESSADGSTTIRFGYYPSLTKTAGLINLISLFHKEYPHIHVKMIPLQYENYKEVVSHYLMTGMLDVVAINDINFNQLIDEVPRGNELFENVDIHPDTYSFLAPPFSVAGVTYAQPLIFSPVILCFNKDHFAEAKLPRFSNGLKWNEFSAHLMKLNGKENYKYPFYFHPASNNRWPIFLLQSGIDYSKGESEIDKDGISRLMDGVQACYDLIHGQKILPTHFSSNDEKVEDLFSLGKISVMMTTYFGLNELTQVDFPYDITPLPYVHEPKTLLLTVGLALSNYSKQKEISRIFINFLASYDSQLHIRKRTLSIPAIIKAAEWDGPEVVERPDGFKLYKDIISTFSPLSDLNLSQKRRIQLLNCLKLYWMGLESKEATTDSVKGIFGKNEQS